jgi:hypothetical protein
MLAYMVYVLATAAGLYLFRRSIIARTREKQKRENEEKERELIRLRNENLRPNCRSKATSWPAPPWPSSKRMSF